MFFLFVFFVVFFFVWCHLLFSNQGFEPEWLYTGENFGKVLTTLLAVNFATQGKNHTTFWNIRSFKFGAFLSLFVLWKQISSLEIICHHYFDILKKMMTQTSHANWRFGVTCTECRQPLSCSNTQSYIMNTWQCSHILSVLIFSPCNPSECTFVGFEQVAKQCECVSCWPECHVYSSIAWSTLNNAIFFFFPFHPRHVDVFRHALSPVFWTQQHIRLLLTASRESFHFTILKRLFYVFILICNAKYISTVTISQHFDFCSYRISTFWTFLAWKQPQRWSDRRT